MLTGKKSRKVVAATLLLLMLNNTVMPSAVYALTSGPTAPEATSFEPIDTTDMVNPFRGDFTYNIPLMDVPGPEGGYPLSLSYHAGIKPNEDASWVGLGWSLNPGAITRSVNGFPDDWYTPTTTSRSYWSGGTQTNYNVGVSLGIANTPATVNFGLSFSQDTYRGFGTGMSVGVGGMPLGLFNASVSVGVAPYGGAYVGGGLGVGVNLGGGFSAGTSVSFSTNFESANAGVSGGIGYGRRSKGHEDAWGGSLLGASISTGSTRPSFGIGGLSASVENNMAGKISTNTKGFSVDIPVWYGINLSLGYSKTRYWSDETVNMITHGSIYTNRDIGSIGLAVDAFDNYSLPEDPSLKNIVDYPDAALLQGGDYPDFDQYSVNAQGLAGNMRPYIFQGQLLGHGRNNTIIYNSPYFRSGTNTNYYFNQGYFRFVNDFSNSFRQEYTPYPLLTGINYDEYTLNMNAPFAAPVWGNNDGDFGIAHTSLPHAKKLGGSRHIDTQLKIRPRNAAGYNKTDRLFDPAHMIEGYSITNESGVTYHFGLPAYTYGEENYQEKINRPNDNSVSFTRQVKGSPYAYTWYLTTITGPDFVDRNNDGIANDGDWGYWVDFEYGKWSNDYIWRNPSEGFHRDEDNEWRNCSMGHKEVYYLNAIRTRSHVALFEKEMRTDAKGASPTIFNTNDGKTYQNVASFDGTSATSLRLNKIHLLNASDEGLVNNASGVTPESRAQDLTNNVLDKWDIAASGIEARSIRTVEFNYDYSLCPETANSFEYWYPSSKFGKLTLKAVGVKGKRGRCILPATRFEYELPASQVKSQTGVTLSPQQFTTGNSTFEVGDMIMMRELYYSTYYGVITSKTSSGTDYVYTLANGSVPGNVAITANIVTTKNPPYNKDAYDIWGMYKSDVNTTVLAKNENLGRVTSIPSSRSADAWSLRKIISGTGAEIGVDYESNEYLRTTGAYSFVVSEVLHPVSNQLKLTITDVNNGAKLSDFYQLNDKLDYLMLLENIDPNSVAVGCPAAWARLYQNYELYDSKTSANPSIIKEIGTNYLVVENPDFANVFVTPITVTSNIDWRTYVQTGSGCAYSRIMKACNIQVGNRPAMPGDGIRVKNINVYTAADEAVYTTSYDYSGAASPGVSSGVTSYEPWVFENVSYLNILTPTNIPEANKVYKKALYSTINPILAISREVPPPGVMYENVRITNSVQYPGVLSTTIAGSTEYQYEVFRDNMVGRVLATPDQTGTASTTLNSVPLTIRNTVLKKFTANIGSVRKVIQYDNLGKKVSEVRNNYLHDGLEKLTMASFMSQYQSRLAAFNYQGFIQERYSQVKRINNQPVAADNGLKITMSAREEYPVVPTGQTVINYVNGTRTENQVLGYDFYSGAVTKTVETDAYGNRFLTENVPAYRRYAGMGLKLNNDNNKNMLVQQGGSYMYKVDAANVKLGLVSASATHWSNVATVLDRNGNTYVQNDLSAPSTTNRGNVWRMQASYNWMPDTKTADGLTPVSAFPASADFNAANPVLSDASWKKTSEVVLYDVYSKGLQDKNTNGIGAATRMTYDSRKVELAGGPAGYYEMAFSGAEDDNIHQTTNGFVQKSEGVVDNSISHTGLSSLQLGVGKKGFVYQVLTSNLTAGQDYMASVWVRREAGNTSSDVKLYYRVGGVEKAVSASSGVSIKKAGDWALINLRIKGTDIIPGYAFEVGCRNNHATGVSYVDDFRFQPVNAVTNAYVYDKFSGELSYMLGNNNLYTRYEYDAAGRLLKTYREKINVGEALLHEYGYNNSVKPIYSYTSAAISAAYAKNDCQTGTGLPLLIQVPAGKFGSCISQPDADAQARAYAQQEANRIGTCGNMVYVRQNKAITRTVNGCETKEMHTITLSFFSDAAGTVPVNVNNLAINYSCTRQVTGSGGLIPVCNNYSQVCNGTSVTATMGAYVGYFRDACMGYSFNLAYVLVLSPGIQIIN